MIAEAFGTAFGLTFIAELGDKTQIAILTLAARHGFAPVFLGSALAFVLLDAISVGIGAIFAKILPQTAVRIVSAAIFIVFGILSFQNREKKKETADSKSAFFGTFVIVALMELGDKTQLALVALTSKMGQPFYIFMGGTLALWLTSLIGAIAGSALSKFLPFKLIRFISGTVFICFGILIAVGVM